MCDLQLLGDIGAGEQDYRNSKIQTQQLREQANQVEFLGEENADQIREERERRVSTARAALASAGVNVDVGTSEIVVSDIIEKSEKDALLTIKNSQSEATRLRYAAEVNRINARLNRFTNILGSVSGALDRDASRAAADGG